MQIGLFFFLETEISQAVTRITLNALPCTELHLMERPWYNIFEERPKHGCAFQDDIITRPGVRITPWPKDSRDKIHTLKLMQTGHQTGDYRLLNAMVVTGWKVTELVTPQKWRGSTSFRHIAWHHTVACARFWPIFCLWPENARLRCVCVGVYVCEGGKLWARVPPRICIRHEMSTKCPCL